MSDLQTPRPMDERRKTYLRLIAEICIAIVSIAAVALLAVFAARYERRYRVAGAPDGIDVHDAPETPSCTQPAFRLK